MSRNLLITITTVFISSILCCNIVNAEVNSTSSFTPLVPFTNVTLPPTVIYYLSVSNHYYSEETEYKANFTLPKGVQVGNIEIGTSNGEQDLSNAVLEVNGLPAGEAIIDRRQFLSSSNNIQYKISPSVVLEKETPVTILLKKVVNAPFHVHDFEYNHPKAGPVIGFGNVTVLGEYGSTAQSAYMGPVNNTIPRYYLFLRPIRSTPYNANVKFEASNDYFGEQSEHIFSFNLSKGMYIGRIGISYNRRDIDVTNAHLEVSGLPDGIASIKQDVDTVLTHNFAYALPKTILLTEDTRVHFKISNIKNPAYAGKDYETIGMSTQVYVSGSTEGKFGSSSFFEYNFNYEQPIKLSGSYGIQLRKREIKKETTTETPASSVDHELVNNINQVTTTTYINNVSQTTSVPTSILVNEENIMEKFLNNSTSKDNEIINIIDKVKTDVQSNFNKDIKSINNSTPLTSSDSISKEATKKLPDETTASSVIKDTGNKIKNELKETNNQTSTDHGKVTSTDKQDNKNNISEKIKSLAVGTKIFFISIFKNILSWLSR